MGTDTNAYLKTEYDAYDVFKALQASKKVTNLEVFMWDRYKEERIDIRYDWDGNQRDMTVARHGPDDMYETVPEGYTIFLHFGYQVTSKPIMEYILGHCGGGWLKLKDTEDGVPYHQIWPYGKQIKPLKYFKTLLKLDIPKDAIVQFFMGDNRAKIKAILG